jgi:hypothetical protein
MAVDMSKDGNRLVLSSFKPKVVDMHSRDHLKIFRETAEATGIGLGWPVWRWSAELGSKHFKGLMASKSISEKDLELIYKEAGLSPETVKKEADSPSSSGLAQVLKFLLEKMW